MHDRESLMETLYAIYSFTILISMLFARASHDRCCIGPQTVGNIGLRQKTLEDDSASVSRQTIYIVYVIEYITLYCCLRWDRHVSFMKSRMFGTRPKFDWQLTYLYFNLSDMEKLFTSNDLKYFCAKEHSLHDVNKQVKPHLYTRHYMSTDRKIHWLCLINVSSQLDFSCGKILTNLPLDKMASISQTIFSDAFSRLKIFGFWLKMHWNLFLRVQLTIVEHRFR